MPPLSWDKEKGGLLEAFSPKLFLLFMCVCNNVFMCLSKQCSNNTFQHFLSLWNLVTLHMFESPIWSSVCFLPKGWIQGRASTWFVGISLDRRAEGTLGAGLDVSMFNLIFTVPRSAAGWQPLHTGEVTALGRASSQPAWLGSEEICPCLRKGPRQAYPMPSPYRSLFSFYPEIYCIYTQKPFHTKHRLSAETWKLKGKAPCATDHDTPGTCYPETLIHLWNKAWIPFDIVAERQLESESNLSEKTLSSGSLFPGRKLWVLADEANEGIVVMIN